MAESQITQLEEKEESVESKIEDWLRSKGVSPDDSTVIALPDYRIIIAIDFGTTNSGYAFVVRDEDEIRVNSYWGGQHLTYSKVTTCVLLDEEDKFVKFGNEAHEAYTDFEDEEAKKFSYFDRFKMMLHASDQPQKLSRNLQLEAANGKKVSALRVFSEVLRSIWENARDSIASSTEGAQNLKTTDVLWVITVPAIWRNEAKAFMREAAFKAGLFSEDEENRMLFALEPEAASIYCSQMSSSVFEGTPKVPQQQLNDQQIVIDAGGGTVDISVHEVDMFKGLHEIHSASGGPWGGHSINTAIWKLLQSILGPDIVDTFKKRMPNVYIQQGFTIEDAKRKWKHDQGNGIKLSLEGGFAEVIQEMKGPLSDVVKNYATETSEDVHFWRGSIHIGPVRTRQLFAQAVDRIVEHVKNLLQHKKVSSGRLRRIYLVGGFALCKYLQHRVREAFETDGLKVLVPQDTSTIVVKGAVCFGKNPTAVKQRIARFTYGQGYVQRFRQGHDPEDKKFVTEDGEVCCRDRFVSMVRKGTPIAVGSVVRDNFIPGNKSQTCVSIPLYVTSQEEVDYTTDESCTELGRIVITFPEAYDNLEDGACDMVLCFGLTEIHALVIHRKSLTAVESKMNFLVD